MYADDAPVSDVLVHALGVRIVGGGGRDVGDWSLKVPGMVGVASGSGSDVEVEVVELFAVAVAVVESAASVGSSSQLAALQAGVYILDAPLSWCSAAAGSGDERAMVMVMNQGVVPALAASHIPSTQEIGPNFWK